MVEDAALRIGPGCTIKRREGAKDAPTKWKEARCACTKSSHRSIILTIQEVLSNTSDPTAPLRGQEFYEANMFESGNSLGTRYCVGQNHAEWSDIDGQVIFDWEEVDYFWILDEAKQPYAERKLALAAKGFIHSDMDLF